MVFGNKYALVWRIYLADGAASQLEVLLCNDKQQRSAVFSKYCVQTLQSMYFYCCQLAWVVFTLRNGVVRRPIFFSQEALDGGALAA
jgi:hypothetical protein